MYNTVFFENQIQLSIFYNKNFDSTNILNNEISLKKKLILKMLLMWSLSSKIHIFTLWLILTDPDRSWSTMTDPDRTWSILIKPDRSWLILSSTVRFLIGPDRSWPMIYPDQTFGLFFSRVHGYWYGFCARTRTLTRGIRLITGTEPVPVPVILVRIRVPRVRN